MEARQTDRETRGQGQRATKKRERKRFPFGLKNDVGVSKIISQRWLLGGKRTNKK